MMLLVVLILGLLFCAIPTQAWVQDQFEIGAWISPPAQYATDAIYGQMAEAGFTVITGRPAPDGDAEFGARLLNLCVRHGIRVIMRDSRIHPDPQTEADRKALDAMIAEYRNHPALYGYFIKDEPNPEQYRALAQVHHLLAEKDPEHLPYINLFPIYGGPHQLEFPRYDQYLEEYTRVVKPELISYDHYPFKRQGERTDFFQNLELARREAQKQKIPLCFILQALQDATRYRPPTLNQYYWQVNAALAYGAKSLWYFPYWSSGDPNKPEEWHYLGLILPDGRPSPAYYCAREINAKLRQLGPMLMGLSSVSVAHLGTVPQGAHAFEPDDLIKEASGDQILLARFSDKAGQPVLMLMNRDWSEPGKLRAQLRGVCRVMEAGRIGPGAPLSELGWQNDTHELSVILAPGEGRIIKLLMAPSGSSAH